MFVRCPSRPTGSQDRGLKVTQEATSLTGRTRGRVSLAASASGTHLPSRTPPGPVWFGETPGNGQMILARDVVLWSLVVSGALTVSEGHDGQNKSIKTWERTLVCRSINLLHLPSKKLIEKKGIGQRVPEFM